MAKSISRTICLTTITAGKAVFEKGQAVPHLEPLDPVKLVDTSVKDEDAALKVLRKVYGNQVFCNIEISTDKQVYAMAVEEFMRMAKPVARPASQTKKEDK